MRVMILVLSALSAIGGGAVAAEMPMERLAADSYAARAVDGAQIASDWCDSCHMVRPGSGTDAAPTFAQIAEERSPEQIRAYLARPHGGMPPIQLSNGQIEDVIAYLKSMNRGSDVTPPK